MRVLLTGLPIRSHLVPVLVPVANALQRAGHEVAIATGGARAAELEALGIAVLVLPDVLAPEQLAEKMPPGMLGRWRPEISGTLNVPLFDDRGSATFARNLLDSGWRPDLIIRETNEYGGFLAADVLGVLMSRESELLAIAVEALGSLPVRAVVASGQDTWTGPRPANVHVVPYVQQRLLLDACDVFVTHAGFSGVRESLSAGVPMVAVPLFSDQPENASRLEDLGLGIRIDVKGLRPDILADAVRRVLDEPSFRHAARGFQRRILGLPTLDTFAEDSAGRENVCSAGPSRA